jgi:hypothetical protein
MSSTYFPINEATFVEDFMDDIIDYEDWTDEYHTYIDNKISYNGTDDNIMIINKYAGGVFEAIKLYKDEYEKFEITDCRHSFYSQLAYVSLYKKFYDTITDKINEVDNDTATEESETDDDTDDDDET